MSAKLMANELSKAILSSNEFRQLLQSKQVIDKNNSYKSSLEGLKAKQLELSKLMAPDQNRGKPKAQEITKYYNQIITNPDIKRYIDAEKDFNEFVGNILKTINDNIERGLK